MNKHFFQSKRNIVYMAAYTVLIVLCFSVGFAIGHHKGQGLLTAPTAVTAQTTAEPQPAQTPVPEEYRVITEDGELRVYCDNGRQSRLISSEKISDSTFPKEDAEALRSGVVFATQEEAAAFIENFVS